MGGIKLDPPSPRDTRRNEEYEALLRDVGVDNRGDNVVQADEVDPAVGVTFERLKRAAGPDGELQLHELRALANRPVRGAVAIDAPGQREIADHVENATRSTRAAYVSLGQFSKSGSTDSLKEALAHVGVASEALRALQKRFIRPNPLKRATVVMAGRLRRSINDLSAKLRENQRMILDATKDDPELLQRYEDHRSVLNAITSRSIGAAIPPLVAEARSHAVRDDGLLEMAKGVAKEGAEGLHEARGPDGVWTTPYLGGPLHSAVPLISMNFIDAPDVADQHRGILLNLLGAQRPDGSFPVTTGQKGSKAATRIVRLAFESALKRKDGAVAKYPSLRAQIEQALKDSNEFIKTAEEDDDESFNNIMADLLEDTVDPDKYDSATNRVWVVNRLGDALQFGYDYGGMSPQVINGSRAMLLLALHQAEKQGSSAPDAKDHQSLLKQLLASQDKDGGWMYITSFTGLSLMALKLEGKELDDDAMKMGIEFLRSMNKKLPDGRWLLSWIKATTWDTGIILDTIARILGPSASRELREASLKAILDGQLEEGRWAFTLTGSEGGEGMPSMGDNDTTGAMVRVLSGLYRGAPSAERKRIGEALRKGALALVRNQQQTDGGFGAFGPKQIFSFDNKAPAPRDSMVNDASSPDVTGRVLTGLLAVSRTGVLTASEQAEVDEAIERAVSYLRDARDDGTGKWNRWFMRHVPTSVRGGGTGMWWNRWIAGQLPSAAFVLPPLRTLGIAPGDPMMTQARRFLLEHQNSDDGGWGETIEADSDSELAGKGPSTPVQTAFAVLGLIATMKEGDEEAQRALERGVRYMLKHRDGTKWKNHRPLYTMSTGLEYDDANEMTSAMVLTALQAYADYRRYGAERTIRRLTFGPESEAPN